MDRRQFITEMAQLGFVLLPVSEAIAGRGRSGGVLLPPAEAESDGADEARGARDPECEFTTRMLSSAWASFRSDS